MAEPPNSSLLEAVRYLQSQLLGIPTPQKLLNSLKRLSALPITLDILVETGLWKTVSALRQYEGVAAIARGLVTQWKKLFPVAETVSENKERTLQESELQEPELQKPKLWEPKICLSRKRSCLWPLDELPKEREVQGDRWESVKASGSQLSQSNGGPKKSRKLDKNLNISPCGQTKQKAKSQEEAREGKEEKEGRDVGKGEIERRETKEKKMARAKETSMERERRQKWKMGKIGSKGKGETEEMGVREEKETGKEGNKGNVKIGKKEREFKDGRRSMTQFSQLHSSNYELPNKSLSLSPQSSTNYQQVSVDSGKPQEKKADQKPHKRPCQLSHIKEGNNSKRCLVKLETDHHHHHQSKDHKSSEKKMSLISNQGKGRRFELSQEKLPKFASREKNSNPSSKTNSKEKQTVPSAPKRERKTEGSSGKKKSGALSEMATGRYINKPKDKDAQDSLNEETTEVKDTKDSKKLKAQEGKKALDANKTSKIQGTQQSERYDDSEQHKMTFESYLLYDQPKKRRVVKTPTSSNIKDDYPKLKTVKLEMKRAIKEHSPMENPSQPTKHQARTGSDNLQTNSAMISPLPVHPSCSGLSSDKTICHNFLSEQPLSFGELNSTFQLKKREPFTLQKNKIKELSMNKVSSQKKVYTDSKNPYVPKMLTLYEQCIKVLKKNIDLIYEVGQVPYNILEPVLEKCSPAQLYRIEDYNPIFLEDSDNLWKVHCCRDFKKEQPEEFESWREMYLRLHDGQEQRLHRLIYSIQLAHAKRPKGRQTKMVFINAMSKSPHDGPGRQTLKRKAAVVLQDTDVKLAQYNLSHSGSHAGDKEPSDHPSTSHAHLAPSESNASSDEHSKKTSQKKVAPVMGKAIKTFKNRFAQS